MWEYPEAIYIPSEEGWQTQDSFSVYLQEFNNWLEKERCKKPCILWLDGHSSHIGVEAATYAADNDIELMKFLPNATNVVQPFDVAAAKPFKDAWHDEIMRWRRLPTNYTKIINKKTFPAVLKKAVEKGCKPENAIAGFEACGLVPWKPSRIFSNRLVTNVSDLDEQFLNDLANENSDRLNPQACRRRKRGEVEPTVLEGCTLKMVKGGRLRVVSMPKSHFEVKKNFLHL